MGFHFTLLLYFVFATGRLCADQISWLQCEFFDEEVSFNETGHYNDTKHIPRQAVLQFGLKDDALINPEAVTFLLTRSKPNLGRFLEDVDRNLLSCKLYRHSTDGSRVRWPVKGARPEYNRWFHLIITHSANLFTVAGFIRHSTTLPLSGRHDFLSWIEIKDGEILNTSVVMIMKTKTPNVMASLRSEQRLDCQFVIDHKVPKQIAVEWHRLGEASRLFSYKKQSGYKTITGSGVNLDRLESGDATYTIPSTNITHRGKYICSVTLPPLPLSLCMHLNFQQAPTVSLNVEPTLTLSEGDGRMVYCEASKYYPTEAGIHWTYQDEAGEPENWDNVTLYSHRGFADGTITWSARFYLEAKLSESGRRFTCTVSHQSLKTPITKTFSLTVQEPSQGRSIAIFWIFVILMVTVAALWFLKRKVQWALSALTRERKVY